MNGLVLADESEIGIESESARHTSFGNILTFWSGGGGGGHGDHGSGSGTNATHPQQRPAIMKIGEATALPVMLCGLLEGQWAYQQHKQMDDIEMDDEDESHMLHPQRNSGDNLRDKITPKFCRKSYVPLPQNCTDNLFRFRRNSNNCRA